MAGNIKNNLSYAGSRFDLVEKLSIIPTTILDVGCNNGMTAHLLKKKFDDVTIFGIDINLEAVTEAKQLGRINDGAVINLDDDKKIEEVLQGKTFDLILLGDVLEHLKNPTETLKRLHEKLNEGGEILVSLPNVAHWEVIKHFFAQKLPRNPRGIFDDTHLQFFMKNNLTELVPTGSEFNIVGRNFRVFEKGWTKWDKFLLPIFRNIPWFKEYFVFQYLFSIRKV